MIRMIKLLIVFLCLSTCLQGQFGPPEPQGSGPKLNPPTVFPPPGTYPNTESVTLLDDDPQPGAAHRVTLKGKSSDVTIQVTSPDGTQTSDYKITVTR